MSHHTKSSLNDSASHRLSGSQHSEHSSSHLLVPVIVTVLYGLLSTLVRR